MVRLLLALLLMLAGLPVLAARPGLQAMIDAAKPGDIVQPEPGVYAGPITIDKGITLDGRGKVTIDAGGKGSVIYLHTDGAVLRNLHLTNSGALHNTIDAGVQVRGKFNVIKDNIIDDCLFGLDLQQSENNVVRRNRISSKEVALGMRGDAVRLWYSFGNKITDNVIRNARDMVVWYSKDNLIARNDSRGGRYALHFMYSQYNKVEGNTYTDNSVGIFLMYSDGVEIRDNYIARAVGATGVGIGFKETSDVTIENNRILYNATALYLDVSPYQPDTVNRFTGNVIAFNNIAVRFLNDWQGNAFHRNLFKGNLTEVVVSDGATANRNDWQGNYWDSYQGFDLDGDGIGDTPYENYSYADRIWQDVPAAQFFRGTPMLEVLDFLERLAPFTPPQLVLRDQRPLMEMENRL
ncbi:nitrous oxide reductase family maturation protein NosD [Thiohalobacter sp. IOR34]|uniref:nitrous oxide reductase family maturation protein NosD n=1 Tax=Thiohalobacter sp. IOR34 TaxID=3057176 RepID=UPI0025B1737E|nr:nitrous oxide reductase family maturation protein NosD [Thiohalobacter sp. IOR34]WJW75958.1 nitrous oxide reductase family maturation protein NosD [Thiohalobacter sp. IOR34]